MRGCSQMLSGQTRAITLLLLASCTSCGTSDLQRAQDLRDKALEGPPASYELSDIHQLEEAKELLRRGTTAYFETQGYVDFARYTTDQALLYLLNDRPQDAKRLFIAAVETLEADTRAHQEHIEKQSKELEDDLLRAAGIVAGILSIIAAKALGDNPQINEAILKTAYPVARETTLSIQGILEDTRMPSPQVPAALDGDFFRMPFFGHFHQLAAVGRLKHEDRRKCTVSLVANRVAVTSVHCVIDAAGKLIDDGLTVSFDKLQNYRKWDAEPEERSAYLNIKVTEVHVSPSFLVPAVESTSFERCRADWALLELADHPPRIGHFDVPHMTMLRNPEPGFYPRSTKLTPVFRVAVAGYSSDLNSGDLITMDYGCPLGDFFGEDVMSYKCATWKGASGAPVLATPGPNNLSRLLGVHACSSPAANPRQLVDPGSRTALGSLGTASTEFLPALEQIRARPTKPLQAEPATHNPGRL